MPLLHDLVFSGAAVLVTLLFSPVVAYVVRRRWRLAAARQAEVRRLALLAAQEAALAEIEAMKAYAASTASSAGAAAAMAAVSTSFPFVKEASVRPECPVCFSPAIARCAQCKAVRYCSGKCQIIHWRQGHKDECHPPPVNEKYSAEGEFTSSGLKRKQAEQTSLSDKRLEHKEAPTTQTVEAFSERSTASEPTYSPKDNKEGDKHEESSFKDVSGKKNTSDSLCAPSIPTQLTFSQIISSPDEASFGNKLLPVHNSGLASSLDIPNSDPRASFDTSNAIPTIVPSPEIARSNSLANNPSSSCAAREKASLSKEESNESISCGPPGFGPTSLDHGSIAPAKIADESQNISQRLGNGIHPSTDSTSEFSSRESALSEARSQPEHNETLTSNKETSGVIATGMYTEIKSLASKASRSIAFSSGPFSSNGGTPSIAISKSSKIGNTPREVTGPPYTTAALINGHASHATSGRRVVKEFTSSKSSRHYSSELMLFPYDRFIKLYNSDKIELRPCGLINCGNSCYANAVLQCLTFTRPLTAYLLEGLHSKICPKQEWCFTCELENLVRNTKQVRSPLSPIGILSHLHNIGSNFGHGQEEDAHEFLRYAIDAMQSVCLKEAGEKSVGILAEETTLVQQIFGGYLRSKIRCSRCKGKSERCERMMDLTVEIDGDIATLDEALSRFTSPEILDGENKYKCDRCRSYERAKKRLTILEAPNVLTIVLKRFQSGKFGKLNKAVRFPEYLDLARYMSGDDKSPVYRLYAVIVHIDVMNASFSGHYVCYVKDTQGKWYKIDDSKVKPVELENVLSKGAYMLLYARCSPRAPSSVRKAMVHEIGHANKTRKEVKGKPGGSSVAHLGNHYNPPRIPLPDPSNGRPRPLHDSSSDSSSLFDEGSTCSTDSTRDSTSIEDYLDRLSGESDSINLNSPVRLYEYCDVGFSDSLGPEQISKAARNGRVPDLSRIDDSGSHASSLGRDFDRVDADRSSSFFYSNNSEYCRNLTERRTVESDWISKNEVKSDVLLRRHSREQTTQTFY